MLPTASRWQPGPASLFTKMESSLTTTEDGTKLENLTKDFFPKTALAGEVAKIRQHIKYSLESIEDISGLITNSEGARLSAVVDRLENLYECLVKRIKALEKKFAACPPVYTCLEGLHPAFAANAVDQLEKTVLETTLTQFQPKRTMDDHSVVELLGSDFKVRHTDSKEINVSTEQFKRKLLPSKYDSNMGSSSNRQQDVFSASADTNFDITTAKEKPATLTVLSTSIVEKVSSTKAEPVGQLALHSLLDNDSSPPAVHSYITVDNERRTYQEAGFTINHFPLSHAPENNIYGHLRFALEFEPIDIGILYAALCLMGPDRITELVNNEPKDKQIRRAWFFYEKLTGKKLPVGDAQEGDFVDALSEEFHFVTFSRESLRHRVRDNLLGTEVLCPTVRRTPKLEAMQAQHLDEQLRHFTTEYSSEIMTRAVNYLMIDEIISSFALEGETPGHSTKESFLRSLRLLSGFNPDKSSLISLQNTIVKPNSQAHDWRDFQNFVGQQTREYGAKVSFVTPRPEDVPYLMDGWMAMTNRLCESERGTVDAVLTAAVISFTFVFIHPFVDGNGRIHRFLVQFILQKLGFTEANTFLPISSAILREQKLYQAALEAFSKPVTAATVWEFTNNVLVVLNETLDLFRFYDATPQAEFLYDRIANTIHHDLVQEINYLSNFDMVREKVKKIVQLPEKKMDLLVRLLLQNKGRLSKNKKRQFSNLTDSVLSAIEKEIIALFETK